MGSIEQTAGRFNAVDIPMQEGFWYKESSQEQNLEFETILSMPKIASNSITIGLGARRAEMVHDNFYSSVESTIAANLQDIINHHGVMNLAHHQMDSIQTHTLGLAMMALLMPNTFLMKQSPIDSLQIVE